MASEFETTRKVCIEFIRELERHASIVQLEANDVQRIDVSEDVIQSAEKA